MAQNSARKTKNQNRRISEEFDIEDASSQQNIQVRDEQTPDILSALKSSAGPAFQEVRRYIDGHPVRAAAIGAVTGGLLMTLFSTEKGRQFARLFYDSANPMVVKYARDYVSRATGDLTEDVVSQH